MPKYKVHFDVNGTEHSIGCESVKVGNMFLQCMADTQNNDSAKVAYIPFDAVLYINHTGITVSTEEPTHTLQ